MKFNPRLLFLKLEAIVTCLVHL